MAREPFGAYNQLNPKVWVMTLPAQSQVHGVLLTVLAQRGGEARPRDIYADVTAAFPEIQPEDLAVRLKTGGTRWINRIQWARQDLVQAGYIDPAIKGLWRLTSRGWARSKGDDREPIATTSEERASDVSPEGVSVTPLTPIRTRIDTLARELETTQNDSAHPQRFEEAVQHAFAFLGYDVDHVGGSGDTDVVAEAPLGINRYVVIVDAKTTARGPVSEAQINWPSIVDHKRKRRAEFAAIVGPAFAGGNLASRAEEYDVSLITGAQLVELVHLHNTTPFTLEDLRTLFAQRAMPAAFAELHATSHQLVRRWYLLPRILEQIDTWNRLRPDLVLAQPMTLFSALLGSDDDSLKGLTPDEVEDALTVLSSEALGILRRSTAGEGFVLTMTPQGASQRLNTLDEQFAKANRRGGLQAELADGTSA